MPSELHFPGRQADEHAVIVLHRHWFVFVSSAAALVFLGAAPFVVMFIWSQVTDWQLVAGSFGYAALVMAGALYYLFLWMLIYGFWLDYYLDTFIITNKRVVDIAQSGLFGRTIAEQRLYRIQDVTSDVQGIAATFFHYGNVYIQTAGKTERFVFEHVPHPEKVAKAILELTDKIDDRMEHPGDPAVTVENAKHARSGRIQPPPVSGE